MNTIALLLIIEIFLLFVAMLISQCDILSPVVIVCFVFFVSTFILFTNIFEWGVYISPFTTFVITISLVSFIVISWMVRKATNVYEQKMQIDIAPIHVSNVKIFVSFCFQMLCCLFYYKEVVRIASYVTQDWGMGLIWKYRRMAFYTDNLANYQRMNDWVTQGYKVTMVIAYIMLFLFVNNVIVNKDNLKKNLKYLVLIPAYIFMLILAGNRMAIMNMMFFAIISWYILVTLRTGVSRKKSMKYASHFLRIGLISIVAFWLLTSVVQRYTKLPFWEMVSIYAGAPVQLLDLYIQEPVEPNKVWGQESLINIINSLYKLGLSEHHGIINLEYRDYNGVSLGNVYTTLRRFIQDYGYFGMIICISLISFFYNFIYYKVIRKINKISYKSLMSIIIYAFMVYPLFLFSIEEYFTLMWSVGYIFTLVLFYVLFFLYTRVSCSHLKIRITKF